MASHLGLRLCRIEHDGATATADVLENAGKYYRVPFCDHSTVPTCALVRSVCKEFGSGHVVLDGTGADGAFGMAGKARQWMRLCSLVGPAKQIGSVMYRMAGCWRNDSAVERLLRLLRRAAQLPYPLAAVAQNPLDDIAYDVEDAARNEVTLKALQWLRSLGPPDDLSELTAIDMRLTCANIFAQKSWSLFQEAGVGVVYPFLSARMFSLAMQAALWPGADQEPKWVLKAALEQSVPKEMVRRPKSGFTASTSEIFQHRAFLAAYQRVADGRTPLAGFLKPSFWKTLLPVIAAGESIPVQTSNLVWGTVFASEWLTQVTQSAAANAPPNWI